jgi:hypothetical protein
MAGRADPVKSVIRWLRLRIRIILRFILIPNTGMDAFSYGVLILGCTTKEFKGAEQRGEDMSTNAFNGMLKRVQHDKKKYVIPNLVRNLEFGNDNELLSFA